MRLLIASRFPPAAAIGTLALFLALGGLAYAALGVPKNSVTSKTTANGQVKAADLAKNAVDTSNLKSGALTSQDIAPDAVDSSKVTDGSLRPADVGSIIAQATLTSDAIAKGRHKLANGTWVQPPNE